MGNKNAPQSSNDSESQIKQEQNDAVIVPTHKEASPCKKDHGPIMKRTSFAIKIQQPSSDITNLYDDESIDKQACLDKSQLHGESTARTSEKRKVLSQLSSRSKSIGDSSRINSSIMKQIFENEQVLSIMVQQQQQQQQTEHKSQREYAEDSDDKNIHTLNVDCRHQSTIAASKIRNTRSSSTRQRTISQNHEEQEEISVSANSLDTLQNSLQYQDTQNQRNRQNGDEEYAKRRDVSKEDQCGSSNKDVSNQQDANPSEIDEDDELFNSLGIIYQNNSEEEEQKTEKKGQEGEHKSLKTILALDQFNGQTYLVKQYSPELARQLDFDENKALALWKLQKTTASLCKLKAISVDKAERLNIVHSHEKGGSLGLFLDTPFSEKEAKIWITKIIQAVQVLHENQIIHGNLKPNNILVGKDELKLTDVNLFKNKKCILSLYSAPELLLQEQLTEKSDIWSIGIIFVEMLCGTVPFLLKHPSLTVPELKKTIGTTKLEFSFSQETNEFIGMMCSIQPDHRKPLQEILNSKFLAADRNPLSDSTELLTQSIFQKTSSLRRLLNQPKNTHDMSKQSSNVSSNLQQQQGGDRSARYGQVSILFPYVSVVNVKQNDNNYQESYVPISEANLMTTNNNNTSNNLSQFMQEQQQQNRWQDKEGIQWKKKSNEMNDQNERKNLNYVTEAEQKQKKKKDLEDQLMAIMNNGECSCGSCYSFYGSQQLLQQQQGQSQKASSFKPESIALTKKQSMNCLRVQTNAKLDCMQTPKGNSSCNNSSIFRPKMSFQLQEENSGKIADKKFEINPQIDREVDLLVPQNIKPIPLVFRQSSGNWIDGAFKEIELQTSKNWQADSRLDIRMEKENSQGKDKYQKLKKKRTKSLSNELPLLHSSSSHKADIEKTSINGMIDINQHKLDIPQGNTWSFQCMKSNESPNWRNPSQDDHHEHHQHHHHHHHHHHHNDLNVNAFSSSIHSSFGSITKASRVTAKFEAQGETPSNKDSLHLKMLDSPDFPKRGMQQSRIQKSLDSSVFRQQESPSPSPSCYSAAPYLHRATGDQLEPVILMSSFPSQDSFEQDSYGIS